MIGLILCAGKGTRMLESLREVPKCMADVGGKPVLERVANHLEKNGVKKIIVNLHSSPQMVMDYFGQRFMYLYEPVPMGEFATVSLIRSWFPGEKILAVNGDTLTDFWVFEQTGEHNGFTQYNEDGEPIMFTGGEFIDIGTPKGLKKARKKYEKK